MSALGGKSASRNVKKGYELDQRRRVKDAIEKQRSARKERIDLARRLGQGDEEPAEQNEVYGPFHIGTKFPPLAA
jgi:hypothetical protein